MNTSREILCWKHTSATWQMWDARSFAWEVETMETTVSILRDRLQQGQSEIVEMSIGAYETTLNLQLWKAYADEIEIFH